MGMEIVYLSTAGIRGSAKHFANELKDVSYVENVPRESMEHVPSPLEETVKYESSKIHGDSEIAKFQVDLVEVPDVYHKEVPYHKDDTSATARTSSDTLPGVKLSCAFQEYAARQFAELRAAIGVDVDTYVQSFDFRGQGAEMKERFSEGKSGSFFYFTANKKFIVKTISKGEADSCLRMAHGLLAHVKEYPTST